MFKSCRWKFVSALRGEGLLSVGRELPSHIRVRPPASENAHHAISIAWLALDAGIPALFQDTQFRGMIKRFEQSQFVQARDPRGTLMLCHAIYNDVCSWVEPAAETQVREDERSMLAIVLGALDDMTYALMFARDAAAFSDNIEDSELFANLSVQRVADFAAKLHTIDPLRAQSLVDELVDGFAKERPLILRVV